MRNFRDAYCSAMNELPKYHIDAASVLDELHHHKMIAARRRKVFATAAAAASVFLLCGIGTATALSSRDSVIRVRNNGFEIAVGLMMDVIPEDEDEEDLPVDLFPGTEPVEMEAVLITPSASYSTVDEFLEQESIVIAIPELEALGDTITFQHVDVLGNYVIVAVESGENYFSLSQTDFRGETSWVSFSSSSGTAVNERTFANLQGLAYVMYDSMEDGEIISINAAITVQGRELSMRFFGYEEEVVEEILFNLDLSVYYMDG